MKKMTLKLKIVKKMQNKNYFYSDKKIRET